MAFKAQKKVVLVLDKETQKQLAFLELELEKTRNEVIADLIAEKYFSTLKSKLEQNPYTKDSI